MNQKTYIAILGGIFIALAALSWTFASSVLFTSSAGEKEQSAREVPEAREISPKPSLPATFSCDDMEGKTIPYPEVRDCRDASGVVVDRALWRRISPATYLAILGLLNSEGDPDGTVSILKMSGIFLKGSAGFSGASGGGSWIAKKTGPAAWEVIARYRDGMSCVDLDLYQVPRVLEPDCYP